MRIIIIPGKNQNDEHHHQSNHNQPQQHHHRNCGGYRRHDDDDDDHHYPDATGLLLLLSNKNIYRFRADDLLQDSREDCYLSTLHIHHATEHDARPYYLVVENERGTDRHAIQLNVEEPLEMSYLLGIAGGCLAALLLLICLCIYAIRIKKCCFK
ncbi:uncharacterized protein LOC133336757, partial [Musca vetustissima]|uniref:uncharacterized protein LOC133336757 n=1 Tax=Musca vetustissima TaxID=27455 RepID=UPI002AB68051